MDRRTKDILLMASGGAFVTSLCCVTPVLLVLFGLSTVSFAASLSHTLYFGYRWAFVLAGLLFLSASLVLYLRRRGICHVSQANKNRRLILNMALLLFLTAALIYLLWNYVVVELLGYWLGIWALPF